MTSLVVMPRLVAWTRKPRARLSGIFSVIVTEFSATGAGVPARASSR